PPEPGAPRWRCRAPAVPPVSSRRRHSTESQWSTAAPRATDHAIRPGGSPVTASNASTTRDTSGIRRLPGRRGAAVVAFAAAAAFGLSACSAGQISQTDTQVAAVTGSSVQSANGDITVNDVQLVLATEQALKDNNP